MHEKYLSAASGSIRCTIKKLKIHDAQPCQVLFWSDASTVIKWICSDHRLYKQFFANRVLEILESSNETQCRCVPGDMNPTDVGTRAHLYYNPNDRKLVLNICDTLKNCGPQEQKQRLVLTTAMKNYFKVISKLRHRWQQIKLLLLLVF